VVFVSPGICLVIYLEICHAGKIIKKAIGLLEFASRPPLRGGLHANSGRPCTLIHNLPCRTPCRLFIHEFFLGAFRPSPPSVK
jgi:hypothetical protein